MSDDRPIFPVPKPLPSVPQPKGLRKTERAARNERARSEWAAKVKARADHRCELDGQFDPITLGCSGPIDAAHILSRGRVPRLILDLENGLALCRRHHELLDRKKWFRRHFNAWIDVVHPGRRARLEEKAIREARLS